MEQNYQQPTPPQVYAGAAKPKRSLNLNGLIMNGIAIVFAVIMFILSFGSAATATFKDLGLSTTGSWEEKVQINIKTTHIVESFFLSLSGTYTQADFQDEFEDKAKEELTDIFSGSNQNTKPTSSQIKKLNKVFNSINFLKASVTEEALEKTPSATTFSLALWAVLALSMMVLPAVIAGFAVAGILKSKVYRFSKLGFALLFALGLCFYFALGNFNPGRVGGSLTAYIILSLLPVIVLSVYNFFFRRVKNQRSQIKWLSVSAALVFSMLLFFSGSAASFTAKAEKRTNVSFSYLAFLSLPELFSNDNENYYLPGENIEEILNSTESSSTRTTMLATLLSDERYLFTDDLWDNYPLASAAIYVMPLLSIILLFSTGALLFESVRSFTTGSKNTFLRFILLALNTLFMLTVFIFSLVYRSGFNEGAEIMLQESDWTMAMNFPLSTLFAVIISAAALILMLVYRPAVTAMTEDGGKEYMPLFHKRKPAYANNNASQAAYTYPPTNNAAQAAYTYPPQDGAPAQAPAGRWVFIPETPDAAADAAVNAQQSPQQDKTAPEQPAPNED